MKLNTILSVAVIAGLFVSASAQAQIQIDYGSGPGAAYGAPSPIIPVATGLYEEVIHLNGNSTNNDAVSQYNNPPLSGDDVSESGITSVATYVASYNPAAAGNSLNSNYTFLNTATQFQYGQPVGTAGSGSTSNYLGADAVGSVTAMTDSLTIVGTIFNASGYIDITDPGSYTFTINSADDAGRVTIGGQTVIEDNYNLAANSTGTAGGLSLPNTADVTFTSAGYYAINVLTYQNGGGANFSFSTSADPGSSPFTYAVAAAPEPSTWAMMLGGLVALGAISRRRALRA